MSAFVPFTKPAVSTTYAAPTLATDGLSLSRVEGIRLIVSAPNGATFSGAGTWRAHVYDPTLATWIRNPNLDKTMDSTHAGVRRIAYPDDAVFVPYGRVMFTPDAVTLSAGTTVDVQITGYARSGGNS